MTDLFSPAEIKYYIISFIGLLLITSVLTSAGLAEGAFEPPEPEVDSEIDNPDGIIGDTSVYAQEINTVYVVAEESDGSPLIESEVTSINASGNSEVEVVLTNTITGGQRIATLQEGDAETYTWADGNPGTLTIKMQEYHDTEPIFSYTSDTYELTDPEDNIGFLGNVMNSVANSFGMVIALFEAWYIVLNMAGWASVFVIAPMTVMSLILVNGMMKVLYVLATAIPV